MRMNMTKMTAVLMIAIFSLSGLTVFGIWTSANNANSSNSMLESSLSSTPPIGTCPAQFFLAPAPNGTLILNVHWTVKNDEDSGLSGYWALDYYTTTLKVWQLSNGNFYAEKIYSGFFESPQGAVSPGSLAIVQNTSVFGTMYGGYNETFTGTFNPGTNPTKGSLGIKDYGGTLGDVLKGTYGNGQIGDAHVFDWTSTYFTGFSAINQVWGWAYLLNAKLRVAGETTNQWCNYFSATTGDIAYPTFPEPEYPTTTSKKMPRGKQQKRATAPSSPLCKRCHLSLSLSPPKTRQTPKISFELLFREFACQGERTT